MALLLASLFHLPVDHIERDTGVPADGSVQRPDNAQLDSSRLSDELGIRIERAVFSTTIRRCLEAFF